MVNKISSQTAKILIETKCVDFSLKEEIFAHFRKKKVQFIAIAGD